MSKGTPMRKFRAPEDLWTKALTVAAERGENLSQVLRQALENYIKEPNDTRTQN